MAGRPQTLSIPLARKWSSPLAPSCPSLSSQISPMRSDSQALKPTTWLWVSWRRMWLIPGLPFPLKIKSALSSLLYSKHLYTHHTDSTTNILLLLLYHISILLMTIDVEHLFMCVFGHSYILLRKINVKML